MHRYISNNHPSLSLILPYTLHCSLLLRCYSNITRPYWYTSVVLFYKTHIFGKSFQCVINKKDKMISFANRILCLVFFHNYTLWVKKCYSISFITLISLTFLACSHIHSAHIMHIDNSDSVRPSVRYISCTMSHKYSLLSMFLVSYFLLFMFYFVLLLKCDLFCLLHSMSVT